MKRKLFLSTICIAIAGIGTVWSGLHKSSDKQDSSLLMENIEALTHQESGEYYYYVPTRTCTCYDSKGMFCGISILAVEKRLCTAPYNCTSYTTTSCSSGCSC